MVLVGYYDGLPVELEDLDLEPLGVAGIVYRRPTCDLCVCFLFVYLLLVLLRSSCLHFIFIVASCAPPARAHP